MSEDKEDGALPTSLTGWGKSAKKAFQGAMKEAAEAGNGVALRERVSSLEAELEAAKRQIGSQQVKIAQQGLEIARRDEQPYVIGTVIEAAERPFRPVAGALVCATAGEYQGELFRIAEVEADHALCVRMNPEGTSKMLPTVFVPEKIDPVVLRWERSWKETLEPVGDAVTVTAVTMSVNGALVDTVVPSDLKVEQGMQVKVLATTRQIVGVVERTVGGDVATVSSVLDEHTVEVDIRGTGRAVRVGKFVGKLQAGDRVQIDEGARVVVARFEGNVTRATAIEETKVTWDQIGGQHEAKEELTEALILPYTEKDLYEFYEMEQPNGVLLDGPPGCGKTTLAKAIATEVAKGKPGGTSKKIKGAFLYVKGSEILAKYVGDSESYVRGLYTQARAFWREHGYPCVVCFDEAEAIMGVRGSDQTTNISATLVPAFLAELDGMNEERVITLILTNRPDMLDPAITRDGRVDLRVYVGRPDIEGANEIFKIHFKRSPVMEGHTMESLRDLAIAEIYTGAHILRTITYRGVPTPLPLRILRSGALIEGIVKKARSYAFRRDRMARKADPNAKLTGLGPDDIRKAIVAQCKKSKDGHIDAAAKEYLAELDEKEKERAAAAAAANIAENAALLAAQQTKT